jgi:putative membrane protein
VSRADRPLFAGLSHAVPAAGLLVLAAPAVVCAQMDSWAWHGEMHPVGLWALTMFVLFLAFWGVVITGAIIALRWLLRAARGTPGDRAIDILRERYARGEIGKEEFEAKLRDLRERR